MYFEVTPDSWPDVKKLADVLGSWIFRGHHDAKWPLVTTIERASEQFRCDRELIWIREKMLIRDFQRRAHHYINSPPATDELLEWLTLVQHYGGPTRLLDFTHSFYIAAFFAVENAFTDACIWAVNRLVLHRNVEKLFGASWSNYPTLVEKDAAVVKLAESYLSDRDKSLNFVLDVIPGRLNERNASQQGLSLFPCNMTKPFEANLCAALGLEFESLAQKNSVSIEPSKIDEDFYLRASVLKINLPRRVHRDAYLDLQSMNIDAASLFPGLDGFARSLYYHLRVMEPSKKTEEILKKLAG